MKIFISWSGERSQLLAAALHEWLPMVLQSVSPWLSHADISAGDRWADTVAKELDVSDFGITCITRENMSSPWIHFEAGALAKRMKDGHVIPLLLDIDFKDLSGPLTQFQAIKADREGLLDVIKSINKLSDTKVSETLLPKQFDALWPTLETTINEIPKTQLPAKQQRPQPEVLEDLVLSVRGLDARIRETIDEPPPFRRRRRRMHPMMLMDIAHYADEFMDERSNELKLLILLSSIKDEVPWLYEIAVDAYQQSSRNSGNAKLAHERLLSALKMIRRGPFIEMFEDKELFMVFQEVDHMAQHILHRERAAQTSSPSKPIGRRAISRAKKTESDT